MKTIFVGYGLVALGVLACFVIDLSWARTALIGMALLGSWYLPVGTLTNLIALILLLMMRR
jgi:hypothetical protein